MCGFIHGRISERKENESVQYTHMLYSTVVVCCEFVALCCYITCIARVCLCVFSLSVANMSRLKLKTLLRFVFIFLSSPQSLRVLIRQRHDNNRRFLICSKANILR